MTKRISIKTNSRIQFIDITQDIQKIVSESGVKQGVCHIFIPHTTAGITINENADPSVVKDIINQLSKLVPEDARYSHTEGNSDAHIKASILGASEIVFIEDGHLLLGTWQGMYLAEFDGPRQRNVWVKVVES